MITLREMCANLGMQLLEFYLVGCTFPLHSPQLYEPHSFSAYDAASQISNQLCLGENGIIPFFCLSIDLRM